MKITLIKEEKIEQKYLKKRIVVVDEFSLQLFDNLNYFSDKSLNYITLMNSKIDLYSSQKSKLVLYKVNQVYFFKYKENFENYFLKSALSDLKEELDYMLEVEINELYNKNYKKTKEKIIQKIKESLNIKTELITNDNDFNKTLKKELKELQKISSSHENILDEKIQIIINTKDVFSRFLNDKFYSKSI